MMAPAERGPESIGYSLRVRYDLHLPIDVQKLGDQVYSQQAGLRIISQMESAGQFGR